ncbi:MAG: DedA family protein [Phenylobacterium zucineum]|nr:MAG: DedA family protein [Phenylobacterium zucineum]
MIDLTQHLAAFGPFAIALGAAVEGQTAVVAGGVMAREQILSPAVVVLAAALGSGMIDYLLFVLGRSFRHTNWVKKTTAKPAFGKALELIERHPSGFILSFRFLYGLRAAGPVAVGVSTVSTRKFAILNAIAAGIWAGAFVALGYAFGPAVMRVLEAVFAHAAPVAAGVAVLAVVVGVAIWRWRVTLAHERAQPDTAA